MLVCEGVGELEEVITRRVWKGQVQESDAVFLEDFVDFLDVRAISGFPETLYGDATDIRYYKT